MRRFRRVLRATMPALLLMLSLGFMPIFPQRKIVVFKGAKLLTVTHGNIENGILIVKDGKILKIGTNLPVPPGAEVINVEGKVIAPGFFDSGDHLGIKEIELEKATIDSQEASGPVQARIRVVDSLNPASEAIKVARTEGITEALVTPAEGNPVSGQSALIRLSGNTLKEMVVKTPLALHITLGEMSRFSQAGYETTKPASTSRMGTVALIRQAFLDAQHYRWEWKDYLSKRKPVPPKQDLNLEVLARALGGELPVIITARRESDIEEALELSKEFHFKLILSGATEAYKIAGKIADSKVPVIVGPVQEEPYHIETRNTRLENAAILNKAGVLIAIQTNNVLQVRDLPFQMEYAIGAGLPDEEALKAVTINPAMIFGVEKELGSLDPGKLADFVVLDGMPFHFKTHVVEEYIYGKKIDLSNHQTRLFEFYKKKYNL